MATMATVTLEEELLQLETRFWQAIKDRDADTAMRLTEDPCMVAGAQGFGLIGKDALASMMSSAPYVLQHFELKKGAKVRQLGDDVAIIAYKVHEELIVDGKPVTLEAADTSTWVKRDGRWLCALHTESIAGDPYGRDRRASPPA